MKKVLALCSALLLGACATQTPQQADAGFVQACSAYGSALTAAAKLRVAGKLSPQAIQQIDMVDATVTPICTGPLPANPAAAVTQINAAVVALGVAEALKTQGVKK